MIRKTTEDELSRQPDLEDLEGYLWRREGARLAFLAAQVPDDQVIVEIGSNRGKSAAFLARGSKAGNGVKVHCVDLWETGGQGEYNHLGFDQPETHETFRRQIADVKVKSMIVEHQGHSVEVGENWTGPKVGLLFLDGDHRYEAVAADLEAWIPHLAEEAFICFHDYTKHERKSTQFPGVVQLVDEVLAAAETLGVDAHATRSGRLVTIRNTTVDE